jgi:hypothetical protein
MFIVLYFNIDDLLCGCFNFRTLLFVMQCLLFSEAHFRVVERNDNQLGRDMQFYITNLSLGDSDVKTVTRNNRE